VTASPDRFAELLARDEAEIDLARACLLIAADAYPGLDVEGYLGEIERLAARLRGRMAPGEPAEGRVLALNRFLFDELGFAGNADHYYDPRNSYLNEVLDRRTGIPITLSVLYLEVGRRIGLALEGVSFPGHFLVRFAGEATNLLVDPFQHGEIRFEDQAQALLDRVYGGAVRLQPEYLRPAGRKDMVVRLLANLKNVYLNARDDARAVAAIERILLVRPDATDEVRDRGMLLARLGRTDEAVIDLERYLERSPGAPDAQRVRILIDQLGRG